MVDESECVSSGIKGIKGDGPARYFRRCLFNPSPLAGTKVHYNLRNQPCIWRHVRLLILFVLRVVTVLVMGSCVSLLLLRVLCLSMIF